MFGKTILNRSSRELFLRKISKTATTSNSDAIQIRPENKDENIKVNNNKWTRLNLQNNNRALSTIQTKSVPKPPTLWTIVSKEESRDFMAIFPDIVRDLTDAGRHIDIQEINKRFAKILQYNVPNGKKSRGLAVVGAYKMFESEESLTSDNVKLANILGWCVEMLSGMFVINSDIMNQAEERRNSECWYKKPDIGLAAINDSVMLEAGIYSILRRYFSNHPSYLQILELFHDVTLKTTMGHSLDKLCNSNLELFTMKRYNSIVKYRNAFYTFQLPVALAMLLANHQDVEMHRQAKTVLLEMGHFYQVQDDFLDCFGDVNLTGKNPKYIEEGRCTWLAVVALQRANRAQTALMEKCYGKKDAGCVEEVRNLYRQLGLPNTYAIYEEESYNLINTHIQQLTKGLPHKLFFKIMERIYKREC